MAIDNDVVMGHLIDQKAVAAERVADQKRVDASSMDKWLRTLLGPPDTSPDGPAQWRWAHDGSQNVAFAVLSYRLHLPGAFYSRQWGGVGELTYELNRALAPYYHHVYTADDEGWLQEENKDRPPIPPIHLWPGEALFLHMRYLVGVFRPVTDEPAKEQPQALGELKGTGKMNLNKAMAEIMASEIGPRMARVEAEVAAAKAARIPMGRLPLHLICGSKLSTTQRELAERLYKYCYAQGNEAVAEAIEDLQGFLAQTVPMGSPVWEEVAAVYEMGVAKHGSRLLEEANSFDCAHAAMGHLARCSVLGGEPLDAETGYSHYVHVLARVLMVIACAREGLGV